MGDVVGGVEGPFVCCLGLSWRGGFDAPHKLYPRAYRSRSYAPSVGPGFYGVPAFLVGSRRRRLDPVSPQLL